MNNMKAAVRIVLSCILIISSAFTAKADIKIPNTQENWSEENVISNRETAIDINDDASEVITRVWLNKQQNIAIKLRELMTGLNYDATWNEAYRYIRLENNENNIKIYVDSDYCEKNGTKIKLNGSVFIYEDYSYCSQWFIENVVGVRVANVQIEAGQRIDGVSLHAPHMPASSRKPFPETTLTVDGKPIYIDYADNLRESLPYNTALLVVDGTNGNGEQVIIYSEATLNNFKIISVKFNDTANIFKEDKIIWEPGNVGASSAVLLKTYIPEGIPVEAVAFTDSKGITHTYLLGYNGKDGSVSAIAVTLK